MQAIYDAIEAELVVEVADAGERGLQEYERRLIGLRNTLAQGLGIITADTSGLDDLIRRVHKLDDAMEHMGENSVLGDGLTARLGEIAADAAEGVRSRAPRDSGLLQDFGIRADKVQREKRRLAVSVLAHVRGKERYNYAWFTNVGTQNHAVDDLGYEHRGTRAGGSHKGIPAQHWFEKGVDPVFNDAEEVMQSVFERIVTNLLG